MSAEPLPFPTEADRPSPSWSPLEDRTRQLLDGLDVTDDPTRLVLAELATQLARSIDAAARNGRASAAAMAGKELRETLLQLQDSGETGEADPFAPFYAWRDNLAATVTGDDDGD